MAWLFTKKTQQPKIKKSRSQAQHFDLATEPQQPVGAVGQMAPVSTVVPRKGDMTVWESESPVPRQKGSRRHHGNETQPALGVCWFTEKLESFPQLFTVSLDFLHHFFFFFSLSFFSIFLHTIKNHMEECLIRKTKQLLVRCIKCLNMLHFLW